MPARLVADDVLIDRLTALLRTSGFDGASLADIAEATGLQKSSLYHRFPGGKQQMATEVLDATARRFTDEVLAPLRSGEPAAGRARAVARRLDAFYDGGRRWCLLEMLSAGQPGDTVAASVRAVAETWVAAFARLARDAGASRAAALERAQDAVASIQGALVVARVTGDTRPFTRAVRRLPSVLVPA